MTTINNVIDLITACRAVFRDEAKDIALEGEALAYARDHADPLAWILTEDEEGGNATLELTYEGRELLIDWGHLAMGNGPDGVWSLLKPGDLSLDDAECSCSAHLAGEDDLMVLLKGDSGPLNYILEPFGLELRRKWVSDPSLSPGGEMSWVAAYRNRKELPFGQLPRPLRALAVALAGLLRDDHDHPVMVDVDHLCPKGKAVATQVAWESAIKRRRPVTLRVADPQMTQRRLERLDPAFAAWLFPPDQGGKVDVHSEMYSLDVPERLLG